MTIFLSDLDNWWLSQECMYFYWYVVYNPACWASAHEIFILESAWSDTFNYSFYESSVFVPYRPLEVQVFLLCRALSWWPWLWSLLTICLIHWIGVLPWSGVYFWCHPWSKFIVCLHCGSFNHASLEARLLVAYLESPILVGMLGLINTLA